MNPKNTCILVVLAAAVFAFIFFFERHLGPPPVGPVKVLPQLKPAAVKKLQLFVGENQIRVERTNDGWQVTYPIVYPAQSAAIENLVRAAAILSPETRILPEELKSRLTVNEEFGFDNPQATLIFQTEAVEFSLKLGSLTAPGDQIYAQVVGSAEIDIIDADFFKKFVPRDVNAWRDLTFVTLTNLNFDHLTVASAAQTFELRRDQTNQTWRMTFPVQTRADNPIIEALMQALQKLRVTRFVTDGTNTDLEPVGLQPPVLELKFDEGTNHVLTLQFGKSPTNDASQIYARRNGQSTIMQVARERVSPWTAGFQEFRDWHLFRFTDGLPDSLEVFNGQENFVLERQSNHTWRMTQPPDLPLDTNAMRAFLENLATIQVVRSNNLVNDAVASPDLPVYGLVTPSRRYLLKRSKSHDGASASNSLLAELDFGSVKDGNISFRRGDRSEESSVYAVKLEQFEKLPATAIQLRERRIWKFSEEDIASITIRVHGNTIKLLHKGLNTWPTDPTSKGTFPNDLETEAGAQELCELEVGDWIARGDKDRARYGFSDKSLQFSVELKSGDANQRIHTLDFGGISPRGLCYGDVRMDDGQNWIFEFSPDTLDRIMAYFKIRENQGP